MSCDFSFQDKSEMELKILMLEKEKADLAKKLDDAKTHSKRQAEVSARVHPIRFLFLTYYKAAHCSGAT